MAKTPKRHEPKRIYHVSYFDVKENKYGTLVNLSSKPDMKNWAQRFSDTGYVDIRIYEYHLKKVHPFPPLPKTRKAKPRCKHCKKPTR